jgi:hypothetical protein
MEKKVKGIIKSSQICPVEILPCFSHFYSKKGKLAQKEEKRKKNCIK